MHREYIEVARVSGMGAARLRKALLEGRPVEFETEGDEVVIKAVTYIKPDYRRENTTIVSDIN